jgi:hypothetical protein
LKRATRKMPWSVLACGGVFPNISLRSHHIWSISGIQVLRARSNVRQMTAHPLSLDRAKRKCHPCTHLRRLRHACNPCIIQNDLRRSTWYTMPRLHIVHNTVATTVGVDTPTHHTCDEQCRAWLRIYTPGRKKTKWRPEVLAS